MLEMKRRPVVMSERPVVIRSAKGKENIYLIMSECTLASNCVHGDMIKACIEVYIRYILYGLVHQLTVS